MQGVFFQKEKDLQKRWIKCINQKRWDPTSSSHISIKFYKKDETYRLTINVKPALTIFDSKKLLIKTKK